MKKYTNTDKKYIDNTIASDEAIESLAKAMAKSKKKQQKQQKQDLKDPKYMEYKQALFKANVVKEVKAEIVAVIRGGSVPVEKFSSGMTQHLIGSAPEVVIYTAEELLLAEEKGYVYVGFQNTNKGRVYFMHHEYLTRI